MSIDLVKLGALAGVLIFGVACGDDDASSSDTTTTSGAGGAASSSSSSGSSSGGASSSSTSGAGGGGVGGSAGCTVPTNATDIEAFLTADGYSGWDAESAVHGSSGPHGMVRTFINDDLANSLTASNASHPVCAASVKELYENDGTTLLGYAVMVKVTDGTTGDDWYWYERIGNNVVADGTGVGGCTGCHSAGTDFFRSPFPLQ